MLIAALASLVASQALVVATTLSIPVLATAIAPSLEVQAEILGFHTAAVFATAFVFTSSSPTLVSRHGPILVSQGTLLLSAFGLVAIIFGGIAGLVLSAAFLGTAYAQGNTASGALLSRLVTEQNRNLVFSIKQTSVPLGGMIAGLGLPWLSGIAGWTFAAGILAALALVVALACALIRSRLDIISGRGGATPPRVIALLRSDPQVRSMALVAGSYASVQFGLSALIVTYLSKFQGLTLQSAGIVLSASMALAVATRIGLGAVADLTSARVVLAITGAVMTLAAMVLVVSPSVSVAVAATVVIMTAVFSWNGLFLAEMARMARPEAVSAATAAGMLAVFAGGALAPAVFAALASTALGYAPVFALATISSACGCYILLAARPFKTSRMP